MKPILCLDFDGVIHSYSSGWKGADQFDPPTPGAIDFLVAAREHFNVAVHSSRFNHAGAAEATAGWLASHGIERGYIATPEEWAGRDWFRDWEDGAIVLTAAKPPAFLTLDDRAVTFTGTFPDPASLLDFRPWNKAR